MLEAKIDTKSIGKRALELDIFADELSPVVHKAILKGAFRIRNTVIKSIARGSKTGRTYLWRGINPGEEPDSFIRSPLGHLFPVKKRNKPHKASASGEAPATDTGELVSSIIVDGRKKEIEVGAEAGAPYAEWLEGGTRAMKARPFLQPALKKEENEIQKDIINAMLSSARDIMRS